MTGTSDEADSDSEGSSPFSFRLTIGAVVIGGVLAFLGLGNAPFWHDEANNALFARNLLNLGARTAWDGQNLISYGGGGDLNEDLEFVRAPPVEQYLAAAGMAALGESQLGARVPFVLTGLLGIGALAWWARTVFGKGFPWWLPAALLAVSPAYLLYIRNARYYAPGILFAILLWAAWSAAVRARGSGGGEGSSGCCAGEKRWWLFAAVTIAAIVALSCTHYVYAISAAAVLPVLLLEKRFRRREGIFLVAAVGLVLGASMLWVIVFANPFNESEGEGGNILAWLSQKHIFTVFWLQVRDMGYYEFFAWPVVLLLALPWLSPRHAPLRGIARSGWVMVACLFVIFLVTAVVTPERVLAVEGFYQRSEIRYSLPALPVGMMIAGSGLRVLWGMKKAAAVAVGGVLVFSNLLHVGATAEQLRHRDGKGRLRSTLADYVTDATRSEGTVYGSLANLAGGIPAGTAVRLFPFHLTYPPMFDVPGLRYCDPLLESDRVRPELRAQLPPHVFPDFLPDLCILYGPLEDAAGGGRLAVDNLPSDLPEFLARFEYKHSIVIPVSWPVGMRPEIPLRWFCGPEARGGENGAFVLYSRVPIASPGGRGGTGKE